MWRNVITRWRSGGSGRKSRKRRREERRGGWNGDQTTALIYLYIRHVGGRGRVHFDYRMTYSDWLRFCGSRMLPIRRTVPREHPSMKMSSTPYGLPHADFYVISTSISPRLLCRYNNFPPRAIISFDVNRLVLHLWAEFKRHQRYSAPNFTKSSSPRLVIANVVLLYSFVINWLSFLVFFYSEHTVDDVW